MLSCIFCNFQPVNQTPVIMKLRNIYLVLIASLIISACTSEKPDHVNLKLIETTDVHGTLFPYDFIEQTESSNSLAQVYSYVKKLRQENQGSVILLDDGDYLQGQPCVYYYNFEDTVDPHVGAQVFNYMAYDAACVGNHDIETGHAVYDRFRKQLKMPYLAANAINVKTGEPYFEPYTIIEKKGIRIAVLGLITPGIHNWLPEKLWSGIDFQDMIETAKKWVPIIQQKENPDLLVGLFHSGVNPMYDNANHDDYMNENAAKLVAEKVPGFDIVLAGHDHLKCNEKVVNVNGDTVLLLNPGSHSRAVAYMSIDFNLEKKNDRYNKTIHGDLVSMMEQEPDSGFMATFSKPIQLVKDYVHKQIGEFSATMDSKYSYFGNSSFMDFIQTVQLDATHADVSFASPLSYRSKIEKGPIYVGDLFKLYKYENQLYTIALTGKEIDGFLEYSFNLWFNQMKSKDDHLLKLKENEKGKWVFVNKYYNFASAAGIDYIVNVSKPEGHKVHILGFNNGHPFYSDSTYKVAVNSYRANGGGGHLTLGAGIAPEDIKLRYIDATEYDIRHLIMKWIEEKKVINPQESTNWRIIPEDYYLWGKKRDMELMFGGE